MNGRTIFVQNSPGTARTGPGSVMWLRHNNAPFMVHSYWVQLGNTIKKSTKIKNCDYHRTWRLMLFDMLYLKPHHTITELTGINQNQPEYIFFLQISIHIWVGISNSRKFVKECYWNYMNLFGIYLEWFLHIPGVSHPEKQSKVVKVGGR